MFTRIALTLTTLVLAVGFLPTSANAQTTTDLAIVTASKGLNLRNQNCGIITTLKAGDIARKTPSAPTINCNINGINYTLTKVEEFSFNSPTNGESNYYAALQYTKPVFGLNEAFAKRPVNTSVTPTVLAARGLNLRDSNCNRISTVANSFRFDPQLYPAEGGGFTICKVGKSYHLMHNVSINGSSYFVAGGYLNLVQN